MLNDPNRKALLGGGGENKEDGKEALPESLKKCDIKLVRVKQAQSNLQAV